MRGFRVWSDFWKRYSFDAELYPDGSLYAVFEDDDGVTHHENTDLVLEFDTGLKDKNDKKIYDGDIVEEDIDFNSKMTDGTFRYKVYWDECWSLDPIGNESIHDELWQTNLSRRVIGNIHEDQDLLGDTNVTNKEEE